MKLTREELQHIILEELKSLLENEEPKKQATPEELEALKQFIEAGDAGMIRYFVDMLKIQVDHSHEIISAIYNSRNLNAGEKHGIAMSMIKYEEKKK